MAMLTWRRCDGRATVPEIAAALRDELGLPADERAVWLALDHLSKAHLLEAPITLPDWAEGYSRRQWIAAVGKRSAALVPAVASILSPTAAAAQSAITVGACTPRTSGSCLGTPCVTVGKSCSWGGKGGGSCNCR
jgi:hypothetical protein